MNITALGAHCFVFIVMGMQGREMPLLLLFNVVDAAAVIVVAVVVIITTVICIVAEMLMK